MPDKKSLDKAKSAADEEVLEPMPPEADEGGEEMALEPMEEEAPILEEEAEASPMASPEDAIQGALDEGITNASDMIQKLQDAGFEVVPAGSADPMGDLPPPPTGAPDSAGGLRDQVRGAAARALRGMA
jgi:hypothetical protein